jgi:hypothetical protein
MVIFHRKIINLIDALIKRVKKIVVDYREIIMGWDSVNMEEIDIIKDPLVKTTRKFLYESFLNGKIRLN